MTQYFADQPSVPSERRIVQLKLPDMAIDLSTDAGVFSGRRVDAGTEILLTVVPEPPPVGDILDLGCGYGPIALTLARRAPRARVWAVDVNERALELVRHNAQALGIANVSACRPEEVPGDVRFAGIYSNPPVRIGKRQLQEVLARWLRRLQPEARAFLVMSKHLGADSLAMWTSQHGYVTRRFRSKQGFRVLEITATAGP